MGVKGLLCSSAAAFALVACGDKAPEYVPVQTATAYCLDDPASPEVKIIATGTDDLMYRAKRPSNEGTSTLLKTYDGAVEGRVLAVTQESCQVYGEHGPILEYARTSSRLP